MEKSIGFLSFGRYSEQEGSPVATARDALHQTIELAVEAEKLGVETAWVRSHHFEMSFSSPMPLLTAMASRTESIQVGTGVIDLRYENPLHLAEEAATTDLLCDGRLQLGVSRRTHSMNHEGPTAFVTQPTASSVSIEEAWVRAQQFRNAVAGVPVARSRYATKHGLPEDLPVLPSSPRLLDRIWWGANTYDSALWAGSAGLNLMTSTYLLDDDGRPLHVQQADFMRGFRQAHRTSDQATGGRTQVARTVIPLVNEEDHRHFGAARDERETFSYLDNQVARVAPMITGSFDEVVRRLRQDEAVQEADQVMFPLPSELGVDYNVTLLESLVAVAEELDWR